LVYFVVIGLLGLANYLKFRDKLFIWFTWGYMLAAILLSLKVAVILASRRVFLMRSGLASMAIISNLTDYLFPLYVILPSLGTLIGLILVRKRINNEVV